MSNLQQRKKPNENSSKNEDQQTTTKQDSSKAGLSIGKLLKNPLILIFMIIRASAAIVFSVISMPVLWLCLPLRPLNIVFRNLGAPNGSLPLDLVQRTWAKMVLWILGVTTKAEGTENVPIDEGVVFMYTHASNLDPFVMMVTSPTAPKFVYKKSLLWTIPWIFPLAYLYGHQPIDRSNRESAIKSLSSAGKKIEQYQRAICIAPEGTRTTTGEINEFKKGPFHLAKGANSAIVPAILFNNFSLWPPKQILPLAGEIRVRFLPKIEVTEQDSVESLMEKSHTIMKKEFDEKKPKGFSKAGPLQGTLNAIIFWIIFIVSIIVFRRLL